METRVKNQNRRLSIPEKNQLRRSIVRLHCQGSKGVEIVKLLGVDKSTVVKVLRLFKDGGDRAILIRGWEEGRVRAEA